MKIVLGIGNPGPEYEATRHNIGFVVVDEVALRLGSPSFRRRFESMAAETRCSAERVVLLKPQTFVNDTGRALRRAADWLDAAHQDILVVVDDYDLSLGMIRLRRGGSSGGHRGLESIERHLGATDVPRLRVGIGSERRRLDKEFVLSPFDASECETARASVVRAADAVQLWMREGIERCMNVVNARVQAPDDKDDKEENV